MSNLDRKIYGFVYRKGDEFFFISFFNEKVYKIDPELQYIGYENSEKIPETSLLLVEHTLPASDSCKIYPIVLIKLIKKNTPVKSTSLTKEDLIQLAYKGAKQFTELKKEIIKKSEVDVSV